MAFGKFIIMMFAVIGLIDGSILALVFRKRRFYFMVRWEALSQARSLPGTSTGMGLPMTSYGFWSLYLAYLLDGIMVACLIIPIPAFILGILSFIPGLRYFISNLGKGLIAIALVIGVYGCVMGNSAKSSSIMTSTSRIFRRRLMGTRSHRKRIRTSALTSAIRICRLSSSAQRMKERTSFSSPGTFIDDVRYMPQVAEDFTKAEKYFPDGIFYIWGNHEYYRNQPLIEEDLKNTPVKMLVNNHTYIEKDGQRLYVAGVDFPFARGTQKEIEEEKMG